MKSFMFWEYEFEINNKSGLCCHLVANFEQF